jgi:hypothetical protein
MTDGPVLMLAGAGTGKTAALTARLAHLLYTRKAWPSEILAVTFTNRAAREMRERVGRLVGDAVEGMPWLGTFHAIGAKMLRRHAELVGLQSNFTILDTDDQLRLLKQLVVAADLDEKRFPPKQLGGLIDEWKNKGLTPRDIDAVLGHGLDGHGIDAVLGLAAGGEDLDAVTPEGARVAGGHLRPAGVMHADEQDGGRVGHRDPFDGVPSGCGDAGGVKGNGHIPAPLGRSVLDHPRGSTRPRCPRPTGGCVQRSASSRALSRLHRGANEGKR